MPDDLIREILAILQRGDRVELIPGKNNEIRIVQQKRRTVSRWKME